MGKMEGQTNRESCNNKYRDPIKVFLGMKNNSIKRYTSPITWGGFPHMMIIVVVHWGKLIMVHDISIFLIDHVGDTVNQPNIDFC